MGVGIDGDEHAGLPRQPRVNVPHVEPVRLGVDLERGPVLAARATMRSMSTSAPGRRESRLPVR